MAALAQGDDQMHVLIVHGTTEGHTRELSQFAARCLREAGHTATVEPAGLDPVYPDPGAYQRTLLAASLHVGRYQPALVHFARTHHESLNAGTTAFLSVSLAAAGIMPPDWDALDDCLARFLHETQWKPHTVHHAAGAIRYSEFDFFKRLALHHLAQQFARERHQTASHGDLTDYDALRQFVLEFAGERREAARPTA
jgi:menaquinone-dependent protoporphyrinogen oxidase